MHQSDGCGAALNRWTGDAIAGFLWGAASREDASGDLECRQEGAALWGRVVRRSDDEVGEQKGGDDHREHAEAEDDVEDNDVARASGGEFWCGCRGSSAA